MEILDNKVIIQTSKNTSLLLCVTLLYLIAYLCPCRSHDSMFPVILLISVISLCDTGHWKRKSWSKHQWIARVSTAHTRLHRRTQTSTNDMTSLIKIRSHHWILGRYFISYIDAFCNQMWVQSNNSNTNITNAVWEPGTGLKQGVHSLYIASS